MLNQRPFLSLFKFSCMFFIISIVFARVSFVILLNVKKRSSPPLLSNLNEKTLTLGNLKRWTWEIPHLLWSRCGHEPGRSYCPPRWWTFLVCLPTASGRRGRRSRSQTTLGPWRCRWADKRQPAALPTGGSPTRRGKERNRSLSGGNIFG